MPANRYEDYLLVKGKSMEFKKHQYSTSLAGLQMNLSIRALKFVPVAIRIGQGNNLLITNSTEYIDLLKLRYTYMTKERARKKAALYLEWADKADKKRQELADNWYAIYKDFDWTEPIKIGHHSERRHRKVFEKRDSFMQKQIELENKAKRFREKADNLIKFANTNKGDAERKREAKRQELDKIINVGSRVRNFIYSRVGTVIKVNTKTYRIQFDDGFEVTQPKHFCEPINPTITTPFTSDNQ